MQLPLRDHFEDFFDQDFSDVRLWETRRVESLGAAALTNGHDILIAPALPVARTIRLLTHELTHIVQRRHGRLPVAAPSRPVVVCDAGLEAEAEANAATFESNPRRHAGRLRLPSLTRLQPIPAQCAEWFGPGQVIQLAHAHPALLPAGQAKLTKYLQYGRDGNRRKMVGDPDAAAVPKIDRERWDNALDNFLSFADPRTPWRPLFDQIAADMTIATFAALLAQDRLRIINRLYNAVVTWHVTDQQTETMFDGSDQYSLPSSVHEAHAFRTHCIGFRCESGDSMTRIVNCGFEPKFGTCPDPAVRGTVMEMNTRAGLVAVWNRNGDGASQTGICVSRAIKGATKFPSQDFKGSVLLMALRLSGLRGFDLENWQRNCGDPTRVWRPGEKMYRGVPKENLLAYVDAYKNGMDGAGNWRFEPIQLHWTFLPGCTAEERAYLNQEFLDLGTGEQLISKRLYDFYSG